MRSDPMLVVVWATVSAVVIVCGVVLLVLLVSCVANPRLVTQDTGVSTGQNALEES